jgi:drug/metabolite transporter (DMT)-like permease
MPLPILVLMLIAATLNAGWNALVKGADDKLFMTILLVGASGFLGALALPFLAGPARASWPFIAASALCSVGYYAVLAKAYHEADLSLTFPLMRGTAPLLVALASRFVVGEQPSRAGWIGVGLICCGILGLAGAVLRQSAKGAGLALGNAVVIAVYTLIDGLGVRRSGAPVAYCLWLFLLTSAPLVGWALFSRRAAFLRYARERAGIAVLGGGLNIVTYATTLWAMTLAPVAVVAALRETSILFAVVISGLVLKERVGFRRIAMACAIAGGAMVLRLA